MACDTKLGLLTELAYKVKALQIEVEKLHAEDEILHEEDEKIRIEIQKYITEIWNAIKILQTLVGGEGLEGYDNIMNILNQLQIDVTNITNVISVLTPNADLDKDKYLYNNGEKVYWQTVQCEVTQADIDALYAYINSLHPEDLKVTLKLNKSTVEIGDEVTPVLTWTADPGLVVGEIYDVTNGTTIATNLSGTKGTVSIPSAVKENQTYKITGKYINPTTQQEASATATATLKFVPYTYILATTATYDDVESGSVYLSTIWKETVGNTDNDVKLFKKVAPTEEFALTPSDFKPNDSYTYIILSPVDDNITSVTFNLSVKNTVTAVAKNQKMQNSFGEAVTYNAFVSTNKIMSSVGKFNITLTK